MKITTKIQKRDRRHRRVRAKVEGNAARPRLSVFKSNTRLVAQLVDDMKGVTIAAADSSMEMGTTAGERAIMAAKTLAERAQAKKVTKVVFDRGGFQYVGTIKAFADAARAAGLEF
jgi:large subunit ribosomal protein L18